MFVDEREPLDLLVELTPRLAKKRFRTCIYEAWDYKCCFCGAPATSLDHLKSKHKGGCSNFYNLAPACRRCNAQKGSENLQLWYERQSFFCRERLDRIEEWMGQKNQLIQDSYYYIIEHGKGSGETQKEPRFFAMQQTET